MAFSSLPLSYKSWQETISSMYKKSMYTFSIRKIENKTPEQRRAQQQSDNLKWQQDMFLRILNMIGLHNEGIVSENELGVARSELLDTLIASPAQREWPAITRDKLLFLQELLYANCISEEDYHLSKRPLLLRLAVQGAEIDSRDVLLRGNTIPSAHNRVAPDALHALSEPLNKQETEWSVVEFKENQSLLKNYPVNSIDYNSKEKSPMKQMINAMSRLSLSPYKGGKSKDKCSSIELRTSKDCCPSRNPPTLTTQEAYKELAIYINPTDSFKENPFWQVAGLIDAPEEPVKKTSEESSLLEHHMVSGTGYKRGATRAKVKKALNQLLLKVHKDNSKETQTEASYPCHLSDSDSDTDERQLKLPKRTWGLDLFKSLKKTNSEEEMAFLPLNGEASDEVLSPSKLVLKPIGEGPNIKKIKRKIHSNGAATDFFIDKVLGENIKTELSRIRAEVVTTNTSPTFTNEQIEAIATRLPVDKNELKKFFPKSWCEMYGDVVLDVVRKEFKHHVGEMENLRRNAQERRNNAAKRWGIKYHEVNCSPKIDNAKRGIQKKVSSNNLNRYFTTHDENSDPNISSPSSSFTGQQPKSPFPFHPPIPKSPSPFAKAPNQYKSPSPFAKAPNQYKSPSPFSPINNHDSPSSPFIPKQSPELPSSDQGRRKSKLLSPFLQGTWVESAARNFYTEIDLENQLNEQLEEDIQRMLPRRRLFDSETTV